MVCLMKRSWYGLVDISCLFNKYISSKLKCVSSIKLKLEKAVAQFTRYKYNQAQIFANQMVRTRHIASTTRPTTSPSLEFEFFNTEGNKEGAVVYCEESALLKHNGKNYMIDCEIPEDITDVFLVENFRGEDTLFLDYVSDDCDMQIRCKLIVVPSEAEKLELCTLLKAFGTDMAEETQTLTESFKRIKTLMAGFDASVESACTGFEFRRDLGIQLPKANSGQFRNMEAALAYLSGETEKLATTELFSNKRKSSD